MSDWIFTFGAGQKHEGYYVRVTADSYDNARKKMVDKYGIEWAFQYSSEEWDRCCENRPYYIPVETELEHIK